MTLKKREPLTETQKALAEAYIPFAKNMAKRFCKRIFPSGKVVNLGHVMKMGTKQDHEEVFSLSLMALCEAAQSFKTDSGLKFATFAGFRIGGELKDWIRDKSLRGYGYKDTSAPKLQSCYELAHSQHRADENWDGAAWDDRTTSVESRDPPVGAALEESEEFDRLAKPARAQPRLVGRMIYVDGLSQGAVAEKLGISKSRVSYLHEELLNDIRHELTYQGARSR